MIMLWFLIEEEEGCNHNDYDFLGWVGVLHSVVLKVKYNLVGQSQRVVTENVTSKQEMYFKNMHLLTNKECRVC